MNYLRFAYRQSEKSLLKALLISLVLGLIFAISIVVIIAKMVSSIDESEFKRIADETGCHFVNYELTCNEDFYQYDGVTIDLNADEFSDYEGIVLSRHAIYLNDSNSAASGYQYFDYEMFLSTPNANINDLIDAIHAITVVIFIFGFIGSLLGGAVYFMVANIILAAVMLLIINGLLKTNIKFEQMYKLTFYIALPYVLFNGIVRMFLNASLAEFITGFIPIPLINVVFWVILDYVILFFLLYYAVKLNYKKDNENESDEYEAIIEVKKDTAIDMPFDTE